jgi:FixJ family two-component response regulator
MYCQPLRMCYSTEHTHPRRSRPLQEPKPVVFLVEDDATLRMSVEALLRASGFVVRAFESATEFLGSALACLVLDVNLPGTSGLELQAMLAQTEPELPIVFVTAHGDIRMSVRAIKAGAVEFLPKPFDDRDLLNAVQQALERARCAQQQRAERDELRARYELLTPRERQVLAGVVAGMLNKQIGHELGITEITVKIHRAQVVSKMKAKSVPDLVRMCERLGLEPMQSATK